MTWLAIPPTVTGRVKLVACAVLFVVFTSELIWRWLPTWGSLVANAALLLVLFWPKRKP